MNLGYAIRKVDPGGKLTALAGTPDVIGAADSSGAAASFSRPSALAPDAKGNIYVLDAGNHTIRKVTSTGVVTTVAGRPDATANVLGALPGGLQDPKGLVVDRNGDLFVTSANAVLKIVLPAQ